MDHMELSLAKTQAKRVMREVRILTQMLAQLEDTTEPKEAQSDGTHHEDRLEEGR